MNKRMRKKRKSLKLLNIIQRCRVVHPEDVVIMFADMDTWGKSISQLCNVAEYLHDLDVHGIILPMNSARLHTIASSGERDACINTLKNALRILENSETEE